MIESDQLYGFDMHHPKARRRPRCGARLRGERAGLFCQRRVVQHRTSCPNHLGCCRQGMSKGATTPEGRKRISEAQKRRWARWREAKALGIPLHHKRLGRPPKAARAKPKPKVTTIAEWRAEKQQQWAQTAEQRRKRITDDLRKRFPQRGF
jgi:hypothetical protein